MAALNKFFSTSTSFLAFENVVVSSERAIRVRMDLEYPRNDIKYELRTITFDLFQASHDMVASKLGWSLYHGIARSLSHAPPNEPILTKKLPTHIVVSSFNYSYCRVEAKQRFVESGADLQ